MPLHYAWEKFFDAVHSAIGSSESPQDRLASAYILNIMLVGREDVPSDEVWKRIQQLSAAITRKPARGSKGTVKATTSEMSTDEAAEWLREIAYLYNEITEAFARSPNPFGAL